MMRRGKTSAAPKSQVLTKGFLRNILGAVPVGTQNGPVGNPNKTKIYFPAQPFFILGYFN